MFYVHEIHVHLIKLNDHYVCNIDMERYTKMTETDFVLGAFQMG